VKVYRELTFYGDEAAIDRFLADLDEHLSGGWSRDRVCEQRITGSTPMYCYMCTASGSRLGARLWLAGSQGELWMNAIVPFDRDLTCDQHNAIVAEFHDALALPAATRAGVKVELGATDQRIEEFLSPETVANLRALPSQPWMHPADRERWYRFLSTAHREGAPLSPSTLERWLIEEAKWSEDDAIELAMEYEDARDLLTVYDSQTVEGWISGGRRGREWLQ
jgi:hypothetical protein